MNEVPVIAEIDGFGPFPAYADLSVRWNGWACPSFERHAVDRMIARMRADIAAGAQSDELRWDDSDPSLLLKISGTYNTEGDELYPWPRPAGELWKRGENMTGSPMIERIEPNANGRYPVGSHEWCWSVREIDA